MSNGDVVRKPPPLTGSAAIWLVIGSIFSVQAGAAVAKHLFDDVSPTAMVWLRLVTSAVILGVLIRPRLRGRSRADWLTALGFGVSLMGMNWAIYQSFARIPLGIAVTIEFLGPLGIAIIGSRKLTDLIWVALAGAGVFLLGSQSTELNLAGVLFALIAAFFWACYILLSAQTGRRWSGLSGLSVASIVGAVVLAGPAIASAGDTLLQPRIIALGLAVGVMSSVLPYSLELIALRHIPPRVFGILMSLEPAAAALAGFLLLRESLTVTEMLAMACVIVASGGATRSAQKPTVEPAAG